MEKDVRMLLLYIYIKRKPDREDGYRRARYDRNRVEGGESAQERRGWKKEEKVRGGEGRCTRT